MGSLTMLVPMQFPTIEARLTFARVTRWPSIHHPPTSPRGSYPARTCNRIHSSWPCSWIGNPTTFGASAIFPFLSHFSTSGGKIGHRPDLRVVKLDFRFRGRIGTHRVRQVIKWHNKTPELEEDFWTKIFENMCFLLRIIHFLHELDSLNYL